jgi:predicted amidohydrolase
MITKHITKNTLNLALAQFKPSSAKKDNFAKVSDILKQSLQKSPDLDLFILPECFTSPYSIKAFKNNSELIPSGETYNFLKSLASENRVNIVGGSFPERDEEGKIYNTTVVFNDKGEYLTKYRKVHLFDVEIPEKISFQESRILAPGDKLAYFHLPKHNTNVGLGICYDIRFPELASSLTRPPINSKLLIFPGAFNIITGPLHWETLAKSRALDNQCFVAVCSPARDLTAKYHAYGHSLVVNSMGQVITEADENETTIFASIDLSEADDFRLHMPLDSQRRHDLYGDVREPSTKG